MSPRDGESESAFGLRCWQAGQSGRLIPEWDSVKLDVMYEVNAVKYAQHPDLQE